MAFWFVVLLFVAALAVVWRDYTPHRGRGMPRGVFLVLVSLRGALVFGICSLLLYPMYAKNEERQRPPRLLIVVDDSASMSLPMAADRSVTRLAAVSGVVDGPQGLVARARRAGWQVELRSLSRLEPVSSARDLQAVGDTTNLSALFGELSGFTQDERPQAIWLFSDGVVTAGGAPHAAARALGVAVSTIGVGELSSQRDVRVVDLVLPPRIFRGERVPVSVILARDPSAPGQVSASLAVDDATRAEAMVDFADDVQRVWQPDAPLVFDATGVFRIRVSLQAPSDADAEQNNSVERDCLVEAERLRVLVLYGPMDPQLGSLRRPLLSDERLEVTTVLVEPGKPLYTLPAYLGAARSGERPRIAPRLPAQPAWGDVFDNLQQFDLAIVGNLALPVLSQARARPALQRYVENGGSLLWLGGERAFQAQGEIDPEWAALLPAEGEMGGAFVPRAANVRFARTGLSSPLLVGLRGVREDQLPPLSGLNVFNRAAAGAETLALAEIGQSRMPLVVHRRLGLGRIALVATNRLWLWSLQLATADDPQAGARLLKGLWRGVIHNLCGETTGSQGRVYVIADRVFTGEPLQVWASVGYEPTQDSLPNSVSLVVLTPERGQERLVLGLAERETNLYVGSYTPYAPGLYQVALNAAADGIAASTAMFTAEARRVEFLSPYRDTDLLRQLAEQTGGTTMDLTEANTLLQARVPPAQREVRRRDVFLGTHPAVLGTLLALLIGEWLVRRRWQLA